MTLAKRLIKRRSLIVPVLSMGEGQRLNILTLLEDLDGLEDEVICIFNSQAVFERLHDHPRIDKYCYNKFNAGVSRSWNMGLNLSEGETVFILNEDLHVDPMALDQLEHYLYSLPKAVMVSPQGSHVDFSELRMIRYFEKGNFSEPVRTHDVSGFLFAIRMDLFNQHKLSFDTRYSPCFMEEWDMGMQVMRSGLACYAVPVKSFEHHWGISAGNDNRPIDYFGRIVLRNDILADNRRKFLEKWFRSPAGGLDLPESDILANGRSKDAIEVHPKTGPPPGNPSSSNRHPSKLYLGLSGLENTGWGVCSKYMQKELSKITDVHVLGKEPEVRNAALLDGILIQGLKGADFTPLFTRVRGHRNIGYAFFEKELTAASVVNAGTLDLVLAGSAWCRDRMREKGIDNCAVLHQGIDPEIFYPGPQSRPDDRFVIFSGGKFELRKGQDLVLRAVKIMQERHSDVWLVNCWHNMWAPSVRMMESSPQITFSFNPGQSWKDNMLRTYRQNGLDPQRIITYDLVPNDKLRNLYNQTDLGVFPNRCEGGTNLVLMEYMACGKPVIASNTSGHRDILTSNTALCLNQLADLAIVDPTGQLICRWQEPSLDELVAQLEYAYQNRSNIADIGRQAGDSLKRFTWKKSAADLLALIAAMS